MEEIVNRVAGSGIVTIDPAEFAGREQQVVFDLAPVLHMGQVLREKDLRGFVAQHDWSQYAGKNVGVTCSADAVVPTWAYMLVALALKPHAANVFFAGARELPDLVFAARIAATDWSQYKNARVVIKGCGEEVPVNAYVMLTAALMPHARSIMYGEPCSTVPLYKSKTGSGDTK